MQIGNLKVVDKGATIKGIVSALDGISDRIGDWVIKRIDAIIDPLIEKQLEKKTIIRRTNK